MTQCTCWPEPLQILDPIVAAMPHEPGCPAGEFVARLENMMIRERPLLDRLAPHD